MQFTSLIKTAGRSAAQLALVVLIFIALIVGFSLGARSAGKHAPPATSSAPPLQGGGMQQPATAAGAEAATAPAEATVWTCSMHPDVRLPQPGKCPKCGMDLIPEQAEPAAAPKVARKPGEPIGWACAMNCVPPLPQPGRCPICGMELQPLYDEAGGGGGGSPQLKLTPEARALAHIETTPVERRWVEQEVRLVGLVDYDETRLAYVTAYVGGRLDNLFVDFTGTQVRAGDHMVYLYSPDLLSTQDNLLSAKRAFARAEQNSLPDVRAANRLAYESARERLRLWGITEEQIAEIEARGERVDHLTIYAPSGGVVIQKHVQEGAYVNTGDRIYTIADLSQLWVKLKAYESDLAWLRYGQDVEFSAEAYPGEVFHGRIAFIDPTLNAMSRTVDVRVNVDNADGKLKPGMYLRGIVRSKLALGGKVIEPQLAGKWICPMHPEVIKDAAGECDLCKMALVPAAELGYVAANANTPPLVIPKTAPLITGKRAVVYVETPGTENPTYEGREITLGPRAGDEYIVLAGLTEGERVVTHGAFRIDSALQIIAKPSMMNPEGGATMTGHDHQGSGTKNEAENKTVPGGTTPAPGATEHDAHAGHQH